MLRKSPPECCACLPRTDAGMAGLAPPTPLKLIMGKNREIVRTLSNKVLMAFTPSPSPNLKLCVAAQRNHTHEDVLGQVITNWFKRHTQRGLTLAAETLGSTGSSCGLMVGSREEQTGGSQVPRAKLSVSAPGLPRCLRKFLQEPVERISSLTLCDAGLKLFLHISERKDRCFFINTASA